jgi:hypothetical protein
MTVPSCRGREQTLSRTRIPAHGAAALVLLATLLAGCGGSAGEPGDGGSGGQTSSGSEPTQDGEPSATTTSDDAVPEVTSTIAGSAIAGNSGGTSENQTDSASETVRYDNGSCAGWASRGGGSWTKGLVKGAKITVRDPDTGEVLGVGRLGAGAAQNVGSDDRAQWMCTFPFTATILGTPPAVLRLDIAGARSMTARPDPTAPGQFVASVSTDAAARLVSSCDELPSGPASGVWDPVVGLYWNSGLDQLCSNGIAVKVTRVCRPKRIGSDYVVAVVKADDASIVYEDASGVKLTDPAVLGDEPVVVAQVANGQPCG